MNFLSGLFLTPPAGLTITEQVQWKKERLMISDVDMTHKIALGFFLDIDPARSSSADQNVHEGLSRFEWFAGSLTAKRLSDALNSFLNSKASCALSEETQKEIGRVISLLQETQEQSSTIDLARSTSLALPMVAITGSLFWENLTVFSVDDSVIQSLVARAVSKIKQLQPGEKAVFLTGTLLHETLLSIELTHSGMWEVCHYDTAADAVLTVYHLPHSESTVILQDNFWEKLYRLKFIKGSSDPVHAHLESLAIRHKDPVLNYAEISKQHKNTCHFRCLLALLKDHIVRHSPLNTLDEKMVEWHLFKVQFGQFLLDEGLIQNSTLMTHSRKAQIERVHSNPYGVADIQEDAFMKSCQAYKEAAQLLNPRAMPLVFSWDDKMPKTIYLNRSHDELLRRLENSLLTVEQLEQLYAQIEDKGVRNTFEIFKKRYEKRHADFYRQLQAELSITDFQLQFEEWMIASTYPTLNEIDTKCSEVCQQVGIARERIHWYSPSKSANSAPVTDKELAQALHFLIDHPQLLNRIRERPHIKNILLQALQQGKFEELAAIYQKMSPEDQKSFCHTCDEFKDFVWTPFLSQVEAYLAEHPDTPYLGNALTALCQRAIQEHDFTKFLHLANQADTFYYHKIEEALDREEIEEEKILAILNCLEELELQRKDQKVAFSNALLKKIETTLTKNAQIDLSIYLNRHFQSKEIQNLLNKIYLCSLYRSGQFQEIEALPPDFVIPEDLKLDAYPFSPQNWQMGLSLLKNPRFEPFKNKLVKDLLTSSYQHRSSEILFAALQAYAGVPDFQFYANYSFEEFQFFIKCLASEEEWIKSETFAAVLRGFLSSVDSPESFNQISVICEPFPDIVIKLLKALFSRRLNELSQEFPQTFLGKSFLMAKLKEDWIELMITVKIHKTLEHPSYVRQRHTFLKMWNLLALNFDFSDPIILYQQIIDPIFNRPHLLKDELYETVLFDLLQQVPSEALQMGVAFLYLNNGQKERAQKFYPDLSKLPNYS